MLSEVSLPAGDIAFVPASKGRRSRFRAREDSREGRTMATLVVGTFLTVDGVMQGPGGPDEDRSGGFAHGGWSVGYWDDAMGKIITEWTAKADALLLGRGTYEIFAAHWPLVPDDDPVGAVLNRVPKYVASTRSTTVAWNNSTLLKGDVPEAVAALKDERSGEIQVHGSCGLLQTLIEHDLIDEYRLWSFPVLLGSGKRLFNTGTIPAGLELVDSTTSSTGVVINRYRRAGDIRYGSFAVRRARRSRGALDGRGTALIETMALVETFSPTTVLRDRPGDRVDRLDMEAAERFQHRRQGATGIATQATTERVAGFQPETVRVRRAVPVKIMSEPLPERLTPPA
jgi:dihydrofolate reductase